jgi:hypothetical protein
MFFAKLLLKKHRISYPFLTANLHSFETQHSARIAETRGILGYSPSLTSTL